MATVSRVNLVFRSGSATRDMLVKCFEKYLIQQFLTRMRSRSEGFTILAFISRQSDATIYSAFNLLKHSIATN